MKHECSIVRDLLPLYAENMVHPDTAAFVEEHLKNCEACRAEYEQSKQPQPEPEPSPAAPLLRLSRKIRHKRIQAIALTAVLVVALLVSAFSVLDAPVYLSRSDKIAVEALGDKGMLLTFDPSVTAFDCTVYDDPAGGDFSYCDIRAWTSVWDTWFSPQKGKLSTTVSAQNGKPVLAVLIPNDGSETVCIARYDPHAAHPIERNADYTGTLVLPRLSLSYYFMLAAIALVALCIVWLLVRKKAAVRLWTERIALYPAAYIVSSLVVTGFSGTSYSLPRDFALIVFLSLLLYSGLLLAHNIVRLQKEIRTMNP